MGKRTQTLVRRSLETKCYGQTKLWCVHIEEHLREAEQINKLNQDA